MIFGEAAEETKSPDINLLFHLTEKQQLALTTKATEILYGGAAGGGKSFLLRTLAVTLGTEVPGIQIYLFRRLLPDLIKTHMEGPKGFKALLAPWVKAGWVQIVEDEIRFLFNGSKIYLCHCQNETDIQKYLSSEMHVLLLDEGTTFSETMYRFLRSRVRLAGLKIPDKYKGKLPRIVIGSNPGGVGHHWVKKTFVDPAAAGDIWRCSKKEGGMLRQFIRARLDDNPFLRADDPDYEDRLSGLGSPDLVRAYRDGDWTVMKGAYFPEMELKHQIKPFEIPPYWTRFCGMDWGYASPFAVVWFAVSDGTMFATNERGERVRIPRDALIAYREWVGESEYNVGVKMTPEAVASGILDVEDGERIDYRVADTSIFDEDGGPSIAESFRLAGVSFMRADKRRIPGWTQFRSRLKGQKHPELGWDHSTPMLYFFTNCTCCVRDIAGMQHNDRHPEDALSEGVSDHAPDAIRYALMSRPYTQEAPIGEGNWWQQQIKPERMTLDEMWAETLKRKKKRRSIEA